MSDLEKLERNIPLAGHAILHGDLAIRPVTALGKIMLQCANSVPGSEREAFGQKFAQTFGPEMPMRVCGKAVNGDGTVTLLCLSPGIWIILCEDSDVETITEWFESEAQNPNIVTTGMTDQYICLEIEGRHAPDLLAKGCSLDLVGESFPDDYTARTLLAQANIVLWRYGDGFRILLDVSLSDYMWQWLEGASKEFTHR